MNYRKNIYITVNSTPAL